MPPLTLEFPGSATPTVSEQNAPATRPLLRLLGGFELRDSLGQVLPLPYDKVRALLAMLVLQTGPLAREALAETLWPDSKLEQARANLRRALFDLRRVLAQLWPDQPDLEPLLSDKKQLQLREDLAWQLDCRDFALAQLDAATPQAEARRQALQQALSLYRGPLLDGLQLPEAPGFEAWLQPRREALLRQAQQLLEALGQLYEDAGETEAALSCARRALAQDPWCEPALRRCMRMLAPTAAGEALALFEQLRLQLHSELQLQPQAATQALAERLRAATAQAAKAPATRAERRRVVALACEWEAPSDDGAREAEAMAAALQARLQQARLLLQARGAHVQRAEGGELLAFFGHPRAQEQVPRLALDAALEIAAAHEKNSLEPCSLRQGLHVGWVHADPERASPDSVGALSRQARKLALQAEAGRILVSAELQQQSERHHRFAAMAGPGGSASLLGARAPQARGRIDALKPMVGRNTELALLRQEWLLAQGSARTVWVQGEPGLGKTRLLQALRQHVAAAADGAPTPISQLQCRPEYRHTPLEPVRATLRRRIGAALKGDAAQAEAALSALLQHAGLPPASHVAARALLRPLLLQHQNKSAPAEPLHMRELHTLLCDLFEGLALGRPQLMLLEDLQWADPSTLELLQLHLQRQLQRPAAQRTPGLLLLSSREAPPDDVRASLDLCLNLQPLPPEDMCRLIEQLDSAPASAAQRLQVLQRAGGVPLFAEELARSLRLRPTDKVPATLWDLLAASLDRLPPEAKRLAQGAALLGSTCSPALLQELLQLPAGPLAQQLAQLERLDLLQAIEPQHWQFRHALIRDAALETLSASERRALHRRAAQALMGPFAAQAADAPEALAQHLHAAGDPAAAHYWLQAAERAAAQSAHQEARHGFEQGLAALQLPEAAPALGQRLRLPLLLGLGHGLLALDGYGSPNARQCYRQALQACDEPGAASSPGQRFQVLWGLWLGSRSGPGEGPVLNLVQELLAVAADTGDAAAAVQARYALGNNLFFLGQLQASCEALAEAAAAGDRLPPRQRAQLTQRFGEHGGIAARAMLGWPLALQGRIEEALQQTNQGLQQARELGHAQTLGFALTMAGVLHRHLRRPEAALPLSMELLALAQRHGLALWQAVGALVLGWSQAAGGDPDGLLPIRQAASASAVAMPSTEATFLSFLIESLLSLGQAEEALSQIDACLPKAHERQELYLLPELWRMRAQALATLGAPCGEIEEALDRAVQAGRAMGAELLLQRSAAQALALINGDSTQIQR
ncbi:AAA family ATPase [Roseateles albus]|uniref:BTAD domain-containing putative transcriptional regulator n=1 Tax=Roseateles albus TaxID=2987525 RepID=A0ABT5KEG5_9BURK|nr:AAA family ATPase [Roseateles albus]MDC8772311.1 BTAD domain-containing putative transcriptional regulator [Roseateles albus]